MAKVKILHASSTQKHQRNLTHNWTAESTDVLGENLKEPDGVYKLEWLEFGVGEIESPLRLKFIVLMLKLLCFLSKHGVLEAEWLGFR